MKGEVASDRDELGREERMEPVSNLRFEIRMRENRLRLPKGTAAIWRFLSASVAAVYSPWVRHEFLIDSNSA
jgi:hypothetical protein